MKLGRNMYGRRSIARYCGVTESTVYAWFIKEGEKLHKYLKEYEDKTLDGKIVKRHDCTLTREEFEEFLENNPKYKKRVEEAYQKTRSEEMQKYKDKLTYRLEKIKLEKEEILTKLKKVDSGEIDLYF